MNPRHRAGVRIESRNQEQCLAQSVLAKRELLLHPFSVLDG